MAREALAVALRVTMTRSTGPHSAAVAQAVMGGGGEVAGFLAHDDFVAGAHGSEVAAEEKTHVMAGADEARAVIEAERARADDGDGERVSHALEEK